MGFDEYRSEVLADCETYIKSHLDELCGFDCFGDVLEVLHCAQSVTGFKYGSYFLDWDMAKAATLRVMFDPDFWAVAEEVGYCFGDDVFADPESFDVCARGLALYAVSDRVRGVFDGLRGGLLAA